MCVVCAWAVAAASLDLSLAPHVYEVVGLEEGSTVAGARVLFALGACAAHTAVNLLGMRALALLAWLGVAAQVSLVRSRQCLSLSLSATSASLHH